MDPRRRLVQFTFRTLAPTRRGSAVTRPAHDLFAFPGPARLTAIPLLVTIGLLGILIELRTPGFGVAGLRGRLAAALGPTISQDNYEVGPEVRQGFVVADGQNERHFRPSGRPDHWLFDLGGYILARLEEAGVRAELAGGCTYAQEELFYSYRRATHRGEPDYGRQISAIVMERG
jgi:hypothetical protein